MPESVTSLNHIAPHPAIANGNDILIWIEFGI